MKRYRLHTLLENTYRGVVYEEPSQKFNDFMALCLREGVLTREGDVYTKSPSKDRNRAGFHEMRWEELTEVIANEIEPLEEVVEMIRHTARMPRFLLSKRIRDILLHEEQQDFEESYARSYTPEFSKGVDVGRPFLLKPMSIKAGVVLAHGYMAAPLEVRALAEYLHAQGYAVYGVRLRGHGTAPSDLAEAKWEDWYESFNRGYTIVKSLTDHIILGGFSTGGCLAMLAAARKGFKAQAVFSICAPLTVRNYSIRFAPGVLTLNSIIQRFSSTREGWRYIDNLPENPHINYTKNPLTAVRELMRVITAMESALPEVRIPALVIQSSKDPVVHPSSGQQIFDALSSRYKELTIFERNRHGIINGEGREDIFERVHSFIERAPRHEIVQSDMVLESKEAAAG
jgi:esterase/lipase